MGSALTHSAPPMSAWPLPRRARYSPRIMKASAPVGSSADSPRRAAVPMAPNLPSMRGTSRIRRLPWRAASIAAFWSWPSTARVTDMWGRTTTSSMGRTGRSSDLGFAIFTKERLPGPANSHTSLPAGRVSRPAERARTGGEGGRPDTRRWIQRGAIPRPDTLRWIQRGRIGPEELDPGDAPGDGPAAGQRVDRDRGQEDQARDDVFPLHGKAHQEHAVVDAADHQAAKHAVEGLAPAAEEARAADDRRGDRVEDVLPALDVVRHAAEERRVQKHADPCREGTERKRRGADQGEVDAGAARGFRVAADRVDVPSVPRALKQDGPGHEDGEHYRDHPGHPLEHADAGPVGIADADHHDRDDCDQTDLDQGEACRRGDQATGPAAVVAEPHPETEACDNDRGQDPRDGRVDRSPHQVVDDLKVVAEAGEVGVARERPEVEDPQKEAVGDQVTAQRDDEGRQAKPGDERALDDAERRTKEQARQDAQRPVPVGGQRLHQLDCDRRSARPYESDRKVDLAENEGEPFGHRQDHEDRALLEELDQFDRQKAHVVRADRPEHEHDRGHRDDDWKDAAFAGGDSGQPRSEVLAEGLRNKLRRNLGLSSLRRSGQVGRLLRREAGNVSCSW